MPELMQIARERVPAFRSSGSIGAGLYYTEVRQRNDRSNKPIAVAVASLYVTLAAALQPNAKDASIEHHLDSYLEHLEEHELFTREATLGVARSRLSGATRGFSDLQASGSHALRLHMDRDAANRFVTEFLQQL